jgi:DNA-binding Lrp family transcriptional regulator
VIPMMSEKGKGVLLMLFKDFTSRYNARLLSRKVGMTARGALKALRNLEKQGFVVAKPFGRAIEYRLDFGFSLTRKNLELLLLEEAELKQKRWLEEFKKFEEAQIIVLFGSVLRAGKFNDVDLLVVVGKENYKRLMMRIEEKNAVLSRKVHPVVQTLNDLRKNLSGKDPVVVDAVRTGVVLKGWSQWVEVIADVSG